MGSKIMKKHRKLLVLLILFVLVLIVSVSYSVSCRTISKTLNDVHEIIFVPDGMANNYKNLAVFSIDEHIIWKYKLSPDEKQQAEQDLKNAVWNKIDEENISDIRDYFTYNFKTYLLDDISDNSYYCLYDYSLKEFINIEDDTGMLGWHRALFVYDKGNGLYYCVSKSI
jgi:hypothetical protein